MNSTLSKVHLWFQANKLNLNPSKTRYMIFNGKGTDKTDLVQIDGQYIERVWSKGNEKSFKLVGIMIDETLSWQEHISYIAKKMGYANFSLNKARNRLNTRSKKLLYSGLIHSHLVYGAPIWGSAAKCRLDRLLKQQKKAVRKIHNLKYRDHTNSYFVKSQILKVPELMEHTTMCYIQSGTHRDSPEHIRQLWDIKTSNIDSLRQTGMKLDYPFSQKEWINKLAPIYQAKLWNNCLLDTSGEPAGFKALSKSTQLLKYGPLESSSDEE